MNKFHTALGQYIDYRDAIEDAEIQRELFLAVSVTTYAEIQELHFVKRQINKYQLKFIVIDILNKKVEQWAK